jgi:hypothetical protein
MPPIAVAQLAEERIVHALLLGLAATGQADVELRVRAAVALLPEERSERRRAAAARLDRGRSPQPPAARRAKRLRALAERWLPAAALVALAVVLLRISTESPSAVADPLESVLAQHVRAGERAGPRRYSMLIERDSPQGLVPIRGIVDIAPGAGRRPDGSGVRGGRFLVRLLGAESPGLPAPSGGTKGGGGRWLDRPAWTAFGFDGDRFWYVPDEGPVRVGPSKSVIEDANHLRGLVSWLVVERALEQLVEGSSERRAGSLPGTPYSMSVEELRDGQRRYALRREESHSAAPILTSLRPSEVVFVAGAHDRVVSVFDAYWPDDDSGRSRHPARLKHLRFELLRDQVPPPEWSWFSHAAHHGPEREVIEAMHASPPEERRPERPWASFSRGAERP